jgi:hypothetical protein
VRHTPNGQEPVVVDCACECKERKRGCLRALGKRLGNSGRKGFRHHFASRRLHRNSGRKVCHRNFGSRRLHRNSGKGFHCIITLTFEDDYEDEDENEFVSLRSNSKNRVHCLIKQCKTISREI